MQCFQNLLTSEHILYFLVFQSQKKIPKTSVKLQIALAALCNDEHTEFLQLSRSNLTLTCWGCWTRCLDLHSTAMGMEDMPSISQSFNRKGQADCSVHCGKGSQGSLWNQWDMREPKISPVGEGAGYTTRLCHSTDSSRPSLAIFWPSGLQRPLKRGWLW